MLKVYTVEALSDNYSYILYNDDSNEAIVIDAPDASPIMTALEKLNKKLSYLLITHHHHDHTQGIQELQNRYNCQVIAPKYEEKLIPDATSFVEEGSFLNLLESEIQVIHTPGHTLGHLVYYLPQEAFLFSGDALFSLGCGRLFEGSASQMYQGLERIKKLPKKVQVFFGHEYTKSNLDFSLSLLPD
ncbi:MAG: hydroxyacylglutathione hydrolase, partial [Chlamydiales bacterium]|nr:hydroxyacylglutathione hydrolase [Chlamydiales bacterium]